jgi:hypothetical protein
LEDAAVVINPRLHILADDLPIDLIMKVGIFVLVGVAWTMKAAIRAVSRGSKPARLPLRPSPVAPPAQRAGKPTVAAPFRGQQAKFVLPQPAHKRQTAPRAQQRTPRSKISTPGAGQATTALARALQAMSDGRGNSGAVLDPRFAGVVRRAPSPSAGSAARPIELNSDEMIGATPRSVESPQAIGAVASVRTVAARRALGDTPGQIAANASAGASTADAMLASAAKPAVLRALSPQSIRAQFIINELLQPPLCMRLPPDL